MDDKESKALIESVKYLKQEKRRKALTTVFKAASKAVPRGIHHPDSTVRNLHLYVPGRKAPKRIRLF